MASSSVSSASPGTIRWLVGALVVYWLLLINQLHYEWEINELYSYGWFVPALCLYLAWLGWEGRPQPEPPEANTRHRCIGLIVVLALGYLPTRLLQEANPDWRLVSWLLAALVVGMTWAALYVVGGRSWWKRFAFAAAFIFVAVPWPTFIEQPVIQGLMRTVAFITVELLNWTIVPARALGNVIELPSGIVGVDEACSGVRSLQAVIMAGLFVGEFYALSLSRRLVVLGAGIMMAFLSNIGRSYALVWIVSVGGFESFDRWHDILGYSVLFLAVTVVWGLAHWLSPAGLDSRPVPAKEESPRRGLRPAPLGLAVGLVLWLLLAEGLTESWYRWHESTLTDAKRWSVQWPEPHRVIELSERELLLLRSDDVNTADWTTAEGDQWRGYFLRWPAGRNAAQLARLHRPEVCLPAAGARLSANHGIRDYEANGLTIPFRHLEFISRGVPLHVFYTLWEDRVEPGQHQPVQEDFSAKSRLLAVAEGRRHVGQQVLELIAITPESPARAREHFQEILARIIQPNDPEGQSGG